MQNESEALSARWQVWQQDTFDRESPRLVAASGVGLVAGLVELWSLHLSETVQVNGQEGFLRYNLWWQQKQVSIEVCGDWRGQVRLRKWIDEMSAVGERRELLGRLAEAHQAQIRRGATSEFILSAAKIAQDMKAFLQYLDENETGPAVL
jgi:hypothetical protein